MIDSYMNQMWLLLQWASVGPQSVIPSKSDLLSYWKIQLQIRVQFSVPQIEYSLGGSSKKVVMFTSMLIVACYYYCDIRLYHCDTRTTFISDNSTIWQNNSITQKTCNRKYIWRMFCYYTLVGILFEVLRIPLW